MGGVLISCFHSKEKMQLTEANSVVYNGQWRKGNLSPCHNLPVSMTMNHIQIVVTLYHTSHLNHRHLMPQSSQL